MKRAMAIAAFFLAAASHGQEAGTAAKGPAYAPETAVGEITGYSLVWHDEFDVDGAPDSAKWNFETGFCRNREAQWYKKDNAVCKDGLLVIEGRRERVKNPNYDAQSGDWRRNREYAEYTSSSLNTWGKFSWPLSEAIIVVRARLTPDKGYFPAIWTTGPGEWPYGGEVDLMECYGGRVLGNFAWGNGNRWGSTWHPYDNPNHGDRNKPRLEYFTGKDPDWLSKFHVWKLVGTDSGLRILLDDEVINEVSHETAKNPDSQWSNVVYPFREKHSLILNLALGGPGGDPAEAAFPIIYEVDYARVYLKQ